VKNGPTSTTFATRHCAARGGNAHLRTFYKTAIANPLFRLLRRRPAAVADQTHFIALLTLCRGPRSDSPDWLTGGRGRLAQTSSAAPSARKPCRGPRRSRGGTHRIILAARGICSDRCQERFHPGLRGIQPDRDLTFAGAIFDWLQGLDACAQELHAAV
jgi:hypothetical protein